MFCYGSNSIEQMRERCANPSLTAEAASLSSWVRVFAGNSSRWDGAVASIIPMQGGSVFGSIVALNKEELERLDPFEGVDSRNPTSRTGTYRHEFVDVRINGSDETKQALAYVKNDLSWFGPPSEAYLRACKTNIDQFWVGASVTVRQGDGTVVSEWGGGASEITPTVEAIFAYGTLRADLSEEGDQWGVTQMGPKGCTWAYGHTEGYRLFQSPGLFYPFATASAGGERGVVQGTLLMWPGDCSTFEAAVERCNGIEGYEPTSPDDGLYRRAVVNVRVTRDGKSCPGKIPGDVVRAYMYYQEASEAEISSSQSFPDGEWDWPGKAGKKQ